MDLRVLTVRQPWAWAIVVGLKPVENRSRPTRWRGPVVIHAGKQVDPGGYAFLLERGIFIPARQTRGAAVGLADLVGCVDDDLSPFAFPGHWHWLMADGREFAEPVSMRGQLGLFRAPAAVAQALADAAGQLHQPAADHHLRVQRAAVF